jgi:hypothetical protein
MVVCILGAGPSRPFSTVMLLLLRNCHPNKFREVLVPTSTTIQVKVSRRVLVECVKLIL